MLYILLLLPAGFALAQDSTYVAPKADALTEEPDTLILLDSKETKERIDVLIPELADTMIMLNGQRTRAINSVHLKDLGHSPHAATMYSALVPGLGQIYNRKYWKLPIVYGGFAAMGYFIHFNGKNYKKYRRAYRDFILRDPNNKSYLEIIKKTSLTAEDVEVTYSDWFANVLRNKKDYYRRYRDLSYFGMAGIYLLQFIDAVVDAHFFNFDVDDNISMNWEPAVTNDTDGSYMGANFTITF